MSILRFVVLALVAFASSETTYARASRARRASVPQETSGEVEGNKKLRAIVAKEAAAQGYDAAVVEAIIKTESNWNPQAMHLETNYRYVINLALHARANRTTIETERHLQKMAFGLMQLTGGTARAISYKGPLTKLLDPAINVHWGVRFLCGLRARYPNVKDQIAAFNAGGAYRSIGKGRFGSAGKGHYVNQGYVDTVVANLRRLKKGE